MADSEMDLQVDGKSVYSLRVVDLKQELKKRDIVFKGNATKAQLQSLLIEHLSQATEPNEDKSSPDSGTTVQSDDTNDTIESNPENNEALTSSDIPKEQTEPTDLSQDSGITSSVSFGDKHSIKLTIKLGNDSPTKQMSPKKSPSKEMRSPPLEEARKPVEKIEVTPTKPIEETKVEAIKMREKVFQAEPKQNINSAQGMITEEQIHRHKVDPSQEKANESKNEIVAETFADMGKECSDEPINLTEQKISEPDSIQSELPSKDIAQVKEDTVQPTLEQKDGNERALQKAIESIQEVAPTNVSTNEDTKQSPVDSEPIDTINKTQISATEESNSEKLDSEKMMSQEIVLIEEVSEDLIEPRVDITDKSTKDVKNKVSMLQTLGESKDSVEENASGVQVERKQPANEEKKKSESEVKSDKAKPRRRRWGGSVNSDAQQSASRGISSDQLKELIPDLEANDNSNTTSKVSKSESIVVTSSLSRTSTEANSEVPIKQDIRVVRKSVSVSEEDKPSVKPTIPVATQKAKISVDSKPETKEEEEEEKEEESKRAVSPPRKPESNILFIQNLVRPFTLLQLKEELGKTGKLNEDRFWIDKIKSKCFVTYETNEEAVATRLALHGTRWPSSNPKLLSVDFAANEELDSHLNPELNQELNNKRTDVNQKYDIVIRSEDQRTVSREKENKTENRPIREWDRDKLPHKDDDKKTALKKRADSPRGRSQERDNKRRRTGEERVRPADSTSGEQPTADTSAKETESPAKLLDDLFRKTNATPSIYWLPLTEEQATVRSAQREEEEKKRTEERLAREEQMRKRQEENRRPFDPSPPFRNERRRPDFSPNRRGPMGRRGSPPFRRSPPGRRSPPRRRSPLNRFSRSRSRSPFVRRKR